MGELLKIEHLSYSYPNPTGEASALSDVSFRVNEGEFVAIVGPCGCGKSTLLSLIAGLLSPSSGFIYINDKDIKSSGKYIGYILQKEHRKDRLGSLYNVSFAPDLQHKLYDNSYVQINELLNTYGLITFQDSFPTELQEGTRQRITLIRTLLLEPDILLLDEPFFSMDDRTRIEAADDIWGIIRKERKTTLYVTHNIAEAIRMADRVIIMSARPGTIKKIVDINLSIEDRTLSNVRNTSEFSRYYDLVWNELYPKE